MAKRDDLDNLAHIRLFRCPDCGVLDVSLHDEPNCAFCSSVMNETGKTGIKIELEILLRETPNETKIVREPLDPFRQFLNDALKGNPYL